MLESQLDAATKKVAGNLTVSIEAFVSNYEAWLIFLRGGDDWRSHNDVGALIRQTDQRLWPYYETAGFSRLAFMRLTTTALRHLFTGRAQIDLNHRWSDRKRSKVLTEFHKQPPGLPPDIRWDNAIAIVNQRNRRSRKLISKRPREEQDDFNHRAAEQAIKFLSDLSSAATGWLRKYAEDNRKRLQEKLSREEVTV